MRQIFLDTETTGLEHRQGHRLIEVAGVEMIDRHLTNHHFHKYVNPQREVDEGALAVHGIGNDFLADKPLFQAIAEDFLEYIRDAELVIHNAPFDVGFLNMELGRINLPPVESVCAGVVDTLKMAKELHPGKKNNLDALCDRYQVDNTHRTLHGALLDAEILAEVYIAMTRGQESLIMDLAPAADTPTAEQEAPITIRPNKPLRVVRATPDEIAAHEDTLNKIRKESKGSCVWTGEKSEFPPPKH